MKITLIFSLVFTALFAKDIYPTSTFKSIGYVNDFVLHQNRLYVANDMGTIDIFDIETQKIIKQIVLPPLETARNRLVPQNIISVDCFEDKVLIISIGKNSYRNVWIYEKHDLKHLIDEKKKLTIKEARFVDSERIIFGTFGSEIILHDTSEKYNIYKNHISGSTMGDLALSHDKKKMVISYESGEVKLVDIASSKIQKVYESQNVDNIYSVAYNSGVIITGGQDRRVGVYQDGVADYHIKSDFMVYCVGLSPDGKTGLYSSSEESTMQLFNTKTKLQGDKLVGHKTPIKQITFVNNSELYSIGSRREILYWRLD